MPKLRIKDIELHYEIAGQGQPVLLIHGLGSSGRDWEPQVEYLARGHRVIAYDVRGHGQSDKPRGPYSVWQFADDAAELLNALDAVPAHVVGISMGGMIAFQLAVTAPHQVRSLVIANSGPALVVHTLKERLAIAQRFAVVRLLGMRKMGEVLAGRLFPAPEQAALRQLFAERWAENDPRAYSAATRALVNWSVAESLASIHCPTLVVASEHDYTPVALKEAYVRQMPCAELVMIAGARHAVPMERPDEFNRVVGAFLDRQG